MRGKRSGPRGAGRVPASTPAYAGQTGRQWCGGCGGGLYPRICGANPIRLDFPGNKPPLPPHMRGKRGCRSCCGGRMASTPAYAGQTRPVHPGEGSLRLYPRICGANLVPLLCVDVDEPLPPHMRGKPPETSNASSAATSTPAYAGQTQVCWPSVRSPRLYPRICGANGDVGPTPGPSAPLPPHMRGKHL